MRVHERDVQEEWDRWIARFQKVDRSRRGPERERFFLRQMGRSADPSVRGRAVGHGPALERGLAAQPGEVVVVDAARAVGQVHGVKAKAPPRRLQVQLAAHVGFVAGVPQFARQRGRRIPFRMRGHPHHPVRRRRLARHQHSTRRDAGRALRIATAEVGAGGANPVHGRRFHHWMAVQPEGIATLLVGHDQQDVRTCVRHQKWLLRMRSVFRAVAKTVSTRGRIANGRCGSRTSPTCRIGPSIARFRRPDTRGTCTGVSMVLGASGRGMHSDTECQRLEICVLPFRR